MANANEIRAHDARNYQVEMLHESLKKNIVIAVSRLIDTDTQQNHVTDTYRWTLAVERPICTKSQNILKKVDCYLCDL